jgi:hypothetical protein
MEADDVGLLKRIRKLRSYGVSEEMHLIAANCFKYERNSGLGSFGDEERDGLMPRLAGAKLVCSLEENAVKDYRGRCESRRT